jgi:hypothetical protein
MKFYLTILIVFSLGFATAGFAQDAEVPKPVVVVSSGPSHLDSNAPSLALGSDTETGNVMVAGFSAGAAYDNRGLASGTPATYSGDTRFFVQPSIGFQRRYDTGDWTLTYTPGVSISQHNSSDNQYTNNLAGDVNWKPNSRFALHGRQDYSLTDNPFETVGRVDLLPGLGGPLGPNYDGVLPETRRTSLVSNVDGSYRLSEHSSVGMTGGYQKYDFDALQSSTGSYPFINSKVISGSVFYSQQLSATVNAGVQFAYSDIYSSGGEVSRTQAASPMLFVKWKPLPSTEVTLFGGPEYARTRDVVPLGVFGNIAVYGDGWRPTYGGTLAWSGGRTAFSVEGMRRISSGGGVLDAVQSTNAGAAYRARLRQRLLAEVRANWADEKAIGVLNYGAYFRSLWAGGGPVFELSRSLALRMDVAYVQQSQQGIGAVAGNHVLVQGSLDYHFRKSLGN